MTSKHQRNQLKTAARLILDRRLAGLGRLSAEKARLLDEFEALKADAFKASHDPTESSARSKWQLWKARKQATLNERLKDLETQLHDATRVAKEAQGRCDVVDELIKREVAAENVKARRRAEFG